ncbi:MAG: repair protein, partial [Deltaproteobacteria bacterium]|nr:repair protein [Deltaproteobacteria bacterium]
PAVILHSLDFAESDKLVTFFTRDFGKLRGIAKGAKRSRKRFGSGLEPLTCSAVCFFEKEKASLVRLDHCEIVDPFPHIHSDMLRLGYAGYLAELISVTAAERERSGELYALLIGFFELLNQPAFREEFVRIFELRLLALAGYQPELRSCVVCRREAKDKHRHWFCQSKGGLICSDCVRDSLDHAHLSWGTIRTLQRAQTIELEKIRRLFFSSQAREESRRILPHFIEYRIEKPLKSLRLLQQLEGKGGTPH